MKIQKIFDKTFLKFIIVGVINTLVGTAIMFIFYNMLNFGYWVSSASNYIVGSVVSYFLNKYFTFKSNSKSLREILMFSLNILVCYLAAYGIAKPLVHYALSSFSEGIRDNLAMVFGMCLFVGLNYIGQRFFVFKEK